MEDGRKKHRNSCIRVCWQLRKETLPGGAAVNYYVVSFTGAVYSRNNEK